MRNLFGVLLLALALTGCDGEFNTFDGVGKEEEPFSFSYPSLPGTRLSVDNFNGSIEITGWDKATIDIKGAKFAPTVARLQEVKVEVNRSDNRVSIRTVRPLERSGNTGARYQIFLPRQAALELIKSTNGAIRVTNVEGAATIRSTNGGLRLSGINGAVSAVSTNGTIEAIDLSGSLVAHTTNGRIKVEQMKGSVEAVTTNGSIISEITQTSADRPVKLSTTNGSIEAKMPGGLKNDLRASTTNGSIDVRLPSAANFDVSARTSGSSVRSDFTVSGENTKKRVEGKVGAGGPLVTLSTSNGGISLQRTI